MFNRFLCLLSGFLFCFCQLGAQAEPFSYYTKLHQAKKAVEEKYQVSIGNSFSQKSELVLSLLKQVEEQSSVPTQEEFDILGEYSYLEFYGLVCKIDEQAKQEGKMLHMLEEIYVCAPLRGVLTRMILSIYAINGSHLSYAKKREAMAYRLSEFRQDFLTLNAGLGGQQVSPETIKNFIQALQGCVTGFALTKREAIQRFFAQHSVALLCGAAFIYLACMVKNFPGKAKKEFEAFKKSDIEPWFDKNIKTVLNKEYIDEKISAVLADVKNITRQAGAGVIEGLHGALDRDPELVANLIRSALKGMLLNAGGTESQILHEIAKKLSAGALDGVAHGDSVTNSDELARENLVVTTKKAVHVALDSKKKITNPDAQIALDTVKGAAVDGLKEKGGVRGFLVGLFTKSSHSKEETKKSQTMKEQEVTDLDIR